MRLLLVGAFPYPHHQGSQVYLQEQAIALRAAGADVELLTYGLRDPACGPIDPARWRALDGFVHHRLPRALRPRSLAAGPGWAKPFADLGMTQALNDAIASCNRRDASFDAVMTHNAEACFIALAGRVMLRQSMPPVIYCVHTLLRHELSTYTKGTQSKDFSGMPDRAARSTERVKRVIDRFGGALDGRLARHVDGWIALTQSSTRVMRSHSTRPGDRIPPPLPDPRRGAHEPAPGEPPPSSHFFLYSGNLDAYQELELIGNATRALAARGASVPRVLVASFDPAVVDPARLWGPGIEARHVASESEMQALTAAARASIVTRRAEGGFPIKLINSLAQGTPAITFHDREWGLRDGVEVRVADRHRPVEGLADALLELASDGARAKQMGLRARARWAAAHEPAVVARQTLALIESVRRERSGG